MEKSLIERLKEERIRLDLTQQELAARALVSRETWSRYESGKMLPGTEVWITLLAEGIDIVYILTGIRLGIDYSQRTKNGSTIFSVMEKREDYVNSAALTEREQKLVELYRLADEDGKQAIESVLETLSSKATNKKKK